MIPWEYLLEKKLRFVYIKTHNHQQQQKEAATSDMTGGESRSIFRGAGLFGHVQYLGLPAVRC